MSKRYRLRTIDGKGQLIMDCKSCEKDSNLQHKHCRRCVLDAMKEHYTVDTVVLSDYKERMYHGKAIEMMDMMILIMREMERLSSRNPIKEYFMKDESQVKGRPSCERCSLNPQMMFPRLINELKGDIGAFHSKYLHYLERLDANDKPQCSTCTFNTGNDLVFLHESLAVLRSMMEEASK